MSQLRLSRHATILNTTISFTTHCFSTSPPDLLLRYFTPTTPRITEHGPAFARDRLPFLAKTFTGVDEFLEYFRLLREVLAFEAIDGVDVWPGEEGFAVDADAVVAPPAASAEGVNGIGSTDGAADAHEAGEEEEEEDNKARGVVTVVGQGRFMSVKTGKRWEERFMHRFSGFDEEGKIGHWEIWADPLSAWLAVEHEEV